MKYLSNDYEVIQVDGKRMLLHRYIMELHLGRKLQTKEIVHHINGNKLSNGLSNLEVLTDVREHQAKHRVLREEIKQRNSWKTYDKKIYDDKNSGMSDIDLVTKYGISSSVITRIVERYKTNEK